MKTTNYSILIISLVLFSCQQAEQVIPTSLSETEIPLREMTWTLVSFESGDRIITPLPTTETFAITFGPDTLFNGHTTVNTYGGPYLTDSRQNSIIVRYIISTRAYGGPNESKFYDGLRQAIQYRATDDGKAKRLKLFYGTDNDVLNFVGSSK